MDKKPSLSQYFGESEVPPASQFFDEIGTSPSDMIQSVYLGDPGSQAPLDNVFPKNITTSFSHQSATQETTFSNLLSTVSTSTIATTNTLPDPSTFFDNIGTETTLAPMKSNMPNNPNLLADALDALNIKNQPIDKEEQRRRDAWLPNEEARKTILKAQSSPRGSFFPEREALTMPGIVLEEELPDALHEVAAQQLGVAVAGARGAVRAEHVSRDGAGLRDLLRTGHWRAAVNLTTTLINAAGQGPGRMHRATKHTPRSLQLWLTRFAVMLRLKMHEPLLKESEPFGDLSKPDMFYEFYPETYENRTGSLAPFSLRLLLAELPGHAGKPEDSLDRLLALRHVVQQMLSNLREGKTEDGSATISSEQDKSDSIQLWTARETRVQHSIVNCAIALKDYRLAAKILTMLHSSAAAQSQRRALASALCRVWLLAGHVPAAGQWQRAARGCPTPDVREYVDLGLIEIANGKYQEAYSNFVKAADQEPTNIMVANNISVCLLYMGRLKEAIAVLQKAIKSDPERGLSEALLLNLCTLYELESSNTTEKKLDLLRMLCEYKSDTIPNVLECLKLS